jgi:hypothetical protein
MTEDPLQKLAQWLGQPRTARQIARQVTVRRGRSRTEVAIDHRLSCPLEAHDGWRVSTKPAFLPLAHFSSYARACLKTADPGRTIYCHDRGTGLVVGALSYHIDQRAHMPVLITAIGLRTDADQNAFLAYRTLAAALVAKQYVHALAAKIGRGGYVDIDLADRSQEPLMRRLGFARAPRVRDFRPAGTHLRQRPPAQD